MKFARDAARDARLWWVAVCLLAWPLATSAVTAEHFQVRTAQDLVELCAVGESDPLRVAALHFCHGFVVGTVQYHQAAMAGSGHPPVLPPH